jgi:hypothetical protein
MQIDVSANTAIIADLTDKPHQVNVAMVRSVNRGLTSARGVMARAMATDTGLKISVVREKVPLYPASLQQPVARLSSSLKKIPLYDFGAKWTRQGGVTAKNPLGAGRYPNAFIATMKSGHVGVFQRVKKPRLPIYELMGPSLGHIFIKYRDRGVAQFWDTFEKNFYHEFEFAGIQNSASGTE